ncbi:hypothetical protein MHBO_004983, partial [Bonamia ostreae]
MAEPIINYKNAQIKQMVANSLQQQNDPQNLEKRRHVGSPLKQELYGDHETREHKTQNQKHQNQKRLTKNQPNNKYSGNNTEKENVEHQNNEKRNANSPHHKRYLYIYRETSRTKKSDGKETGTAKKSDEENGVKDEKVKTE